MSYLGWNSGCGGDLITLTAVEVAHGYRASERERERGKRDEKKEICWLAWGLLFIGLFNFLAQ